jgi:hypothetical protein
MRGELTCARSASANASAQRAGGWSRCHRTRVTPTSLAPSSWPAVLADLSVSRSRRKRRPDQGEVPVVGDQMAAWLRYPGQGDTLYVNLPICITLQPVYGIRRLPQAVAPRVQAVHAGGAGAGQRVEYAVVPLDPGQLFGRPPRQAPAPGGPPWRARLRTWPKSDMIRIQFSNN